MSRRSFSSVGSGYRPTAWCPNCAAPYPAHLTECPECKARVTFDDARNLLEKHGFKPAPEQPEPGLDEAQVRG